MILFLGDYEHQYYIEDAAKAMGEEIQGSGQNLYHADTISDACMSHDSVDIVVINIESMMDIPQDIGDALEAVQEETGAVIVLMDIGANPEDGNLGYLYRRGFHNLIVSPILGKAKQQAKRALANQGLETSSESSPSKAENSVENSSSGIYEPDSKENSDFEENLEESEEPEQSEESVSRLQQPRVVAFAGCAKRIGTTTQTIQAAVFLASFNKRVVVLEHNQTGWVRAFADQKQLEYTNSQTRTLEYHNITMLENGHSVSEFSRDEVDVVCVDCGAIPARDFDKEVFLHSDIQVVVFGSMPGEGMKLAQALAKSELPSMFYICSSAAQEEQVEIMYSFGGVSSKVFFTPYISNRFDYCEDAAPMDARILKRKGEPFSSEWQKDLVFGTTRHFSVQPKEDKGKHKHRNHKKHRRE